MAIANTTHTPHVRCHSQCPCPQRARCWQWFEAGRASRQPRARIGRPVLRANFRCVWTLGFWSLSGFFMSCIRRTLLLAFWSGLQVLKVRT